MKLPNPYTQRELADSRNVPPRNEPFAAINVSFHETYTRLVEQVLAQLGDSIPVAILLGDDATLLCDGRELREQVIPARYHELKALAHFAFGVQLTLMLSRRRVSAAKITALLLERRNVAGGNLPPAIPLNKCVCELDDSIERFAVRLSFHMRFSKNNRCVVAVQAALHLVVFKCVVMDFPAA